MCDTNSCVHIVTCTYFLKKCYILLDFMCTHKSDGKVHNPIHVLAKLCKSVKFKPEYCYLRTSMFSTSVQSNSRNTVSALRAVVKGPLAHVLLETYCCKIQLWLNLIIMGFLLLQIRYILFL